MEQKKLRKGVIKETAHIQKTRRIECDYYSPEEIELYKYCKGYVPSYVNIDQRSQSHTD